MTPSVYMADLRHTYLGVLGSDAMPVNIGYLKAVMDRDLPEVSSRLFVYPERLIAAIKGSPPDVLMVSNYTWNEQLSLHAARTLKAIRPDALVVMGGPNIHDEPERQQDYMRQHPELDLYLLGEGDFLATEVTRHFLDAGLSLARFATRDIPSSVYARPDGTMVTGEVPKRRRGLGEIPSPWLTGVMDGFFDGKLAPLWETNRGCPFTCSFCVQGTEYYNRVSYFDEERLREEIHYMGRMIHEHSPTVGTLRIADPNYGMYKRDPVLSEYIGEVQQLYGWPTFIDATTGKNRPDRIIDSLEKVSGALVLYQAVQSLDEDVLRKVKRQNIKIEAYEALQVHMRGRGLKSSSDLILGLPGETLESHVTGLKRMIDAGVTRLNNFQCMMLKGTELERQESRDLFGFQTRYRVVPKALGLYDDEAVFEDEEIIVATDSLSFDDYLQARLHHLACTMFLNNGRMETLFRFVESFGGKRSSLFTRLVEAMESDRATVRALLDAFLDETRNELFTTREEMVEFYRDPDNLDRLSKSEIGDNLMYKYSALANLWHWREVSALALDATREELESLDVRGQIQSFEPFWADFAAYESKRFATGSTVDELTAPEESEISYDIGAWIAADMPRGVEDFRLASPVAARFELNDESVRELKHAVATYGLSTSGASMLIKRIRMSGLEREFTLPGPAAS